MNSLLNDYSLKNETLSYGKLESDGIARRRLVLFFVQLGIVTKPGSDQTWLAPLLSRNNKKRYSTIQRGTASFSSIRVDDCTTKKQYQHNFLRVSLNLLILVHTPIFALPKNTILSLIKIPSLFSSSSF